MKNLIRQAAQKVRELLVQGLTPERIALTVVSGAFLGINPAIGSTTLLCTLIALGLGLNLPLIQITNYAVYPLEILFLVPFIELGHWIVSGRPLTLTRAEILSRFQIGWIPALEQLWTYLLQGLLGWVLVSLALAPPCYWVLSRLLRRLRSTPRGSAESSSVLTVSRKPDK
jgi:uncharacterized protein (DUF2062 family)